RARHLAVAPVPRISGAPLRCRSRCKASGTLDGVGRVRSLSRHALAGPIPVFSCFFADSESSIPVSRSQAHTHLLVPAAHVCARGLHLCFTHPESRGGRSAEKRSRAALSTREARHLASKTRVNALMTRRTRRLARRLASHDAGRSPLGAPPWRFWVPGARFSHRHLRRLQRAPRTQVVMPGGRGPEPPGANGYKPPPQDATPRSAFRFVSRTRPQ